VTEPAFFLFFKAQIQAQRIVISMRKAEVLIKEQDADRVCRFCGKQYDYYRRDESGLGVCPRMRSFFSEWCSKECFWNDFLAQAKAEMAKAGKKT
jgi:hypothetical protein